MSDQATEPSAFTVFFAPRRRRSTALTEADMSKRLPPYGFTCKVHHLTRVGGTFSMRLP